MGAMALGCERVHLFHTFACGYGVRDLVNDGKELESLRSLYICLLQRVAFEHLGRTVDGVLSFSGE